MNSGAFISQNHRTVRNLQRSLSPAPFLSRLLQQATEPGAVLLHEEEPSLWRGSRAGQSQERWTELCKGLFHMMSHHKAIKLWRTKQSLAATQGLTEMLHSQQYVSQKAVVFLTWCQMANNCIMKMWVCNAFTHIANICYYLQTDVHHVPAQDMTQQRVVSQYGQVVVRLDDL